MELYFQSHTAQMADHIRRLPRNPFLRERRSARNPFFGDEEETQQRVDAWVEEARGLIQSPAPMEGDPRLKDVWQRHRETYNMLSDIEEFIGYNRYFVQHHDDYMDNALHYMGTPPPNSASTFIDVLDKVEDKIENFTHLNTSVHGTAAHERYMDTMEDFNDKWQNEVFEEALEGGTNEEGVQWI